MPEDVDPQIALMRPISLAANQPPAAPQFASMPTPTAPTIEQPQPQPQKASNQPQVTNLESNRVAPDSITASQEFVNKVVRSVSSLRSAVVGQRPPPVLNERPFR